MSVDLPISNGLIDYDFTVDLSGTFYTLRFRYNYRSNTWMMDINNQTGDALYVGIPIYINVDILRQIRSYNIPKDILLALNNFDSTADPDRNSFSEDVVLTYGITASDV